MIDRTIAITLLLTFTSLRVGQNLVLVMLGAVFWFLAALLVRTIEPMGGLQGIGIVLLYAVLIPGTVPFVLLGRRLARLALHQTALGVAIMTASATLLDGIALAAFPSLYGANAAAAGAAILWGAGVGLALGIVMNGPERR